MTAGGFVTELRNRFDPIAISRGMTFVSSTKIRVTYRGPGIAVEFWWYNWRSFDLSVVFRAQDDTALHLHELLAVRHPEAATRVESLQAVEGERMNVCLDYLVDLLERFADDILKGDEAAFFQLVRVREARRRGT
jgi:hypothetical protein